MFKKIASLVLAVLMIASVASVLASCGTDDGFKVGVILIGDETEGYTKAHMDGIKAREFSTLLGGFLNGLDHGNLKYSDYFIIILHGV